MKTIFSFISFLVFLLCPTQTHATSSLEFFPVQQKDTRVRALEEVFKQYNSPLLPYAQDFVKYADKHNVDWRLLPAISGQESSFGLFMIDGTFNAYGWGSGYIYFYSWEHGMDTIYSMLRSYYIEQNGARTISEIGNIYAEDPNWPQGVEKFVQEITYEYEKLRFQNFRKLLTLDNFSMRSL